MITEDKVVSELKEEKLRRKIICNATRCFFFHIFTILFQILQRIRIIRMDESRLKNLWIMESNMFLEAKHLHNECSKWRTCLSIFYLNCKFLFIHLLHRTLDHLLLSVMSFNIHFELR